MENFGDYSATLLDHCRHPRNVGEVENSPAVAQVGDPAHGDVLRLSLRIEKDTVIEARFKSFGCSAAIAAGSMVTEMITGRPVAEVERLTNRDVAEALGGLPEGKQHCSVLAEQAIQEALRSWRADKEERCRSSASR